jgi:hypothetical protein
VRGHDEGDTRVDGLPERHALDAPDAVGRMLDQRQIEV